MSSNGNSIEKECDTYIRTIIAHYISVWYYPFVSTDQDFPDDLLILFNVILNRLNDRLKSLNYYHIIRSVTNLTQVHMKQYLETHDSYRKLTKENRTNKSFIGEYLQIFGFHHSLKKNDTHAYFKAITELLLTDLIPESFHIYSTSRVGREFLNEILVNTVMLPLFETFSKPQMIFYLMVLLWESEDQRKNFDITDDSSIVSKTDNSNRNVKKAVSFDEDFEEQTIHDDERRSSTSSSSHERIIYSATINSTDTAYNSMSGAAYTVYVIQCETKSPYKSDAIDRYLIKRRYREFINLHKTLKQNSRTSQYCTELDEILQNLPRTIDNMNANIIHKRREKFEEYIQKLIANEFLNSCHSVLEFFAFNTDANKQFECSQSSKLPVPRVDKALRRTLSDMGSKLNKLLPTKRELNPIRETFQLSVSTTFENTSSTMEQLKSYIDNSRFHYSSYSLKLSSNDSELLQSLLTRSSIVLSSRRKPQIQSDIPLTDALIDLIHTCLHSRDTLLKNRSIHHILRTIFGHFVEEFLKNEIDQLLSQDNIVFYLHTLRTKVFWPNKNENEFISNRTIRKRAFNACMNIIPVWLQHIVGVENLRQIIKDIFECLNLKELNQNFICNLFDLFVEQFIPNITSEQFLRKYVQMHSGR